MKKLIITSMVLAMGTMAFGATSSNPETASSNVKVTAQVVADNLIISDLSGRPIVLDFGKISNQKTDGVSNARVDFKVENVGAPGTLTNIDVELIGLTDSKVNLLNTNVASNIDNKKIPATIELNSPTGTFTGDKYIGFIQGSIAGKDSNGKEASTYENILELKATAK